MRLRLALAAAVLLFAARASRADEPSAGNAAEALAQKRADTVVTLKYVFKGDGREFPRTAQGTVIDPSGLVLISNSLVTWSGGSPSNVRVLFGSDPKEWPAVIAARDTIFDLAYVQITESLGDKKLAYVDFPPGPPIEVGQDLFLVWRDRQGFDFAPIVSRHYVRGHVEKPRAMWSLGGDAANVGLPMYDANGRVVGVTAYQRGSDAVGSSEGGSQRRAFLIALGDVLPSIASGKKHGAEEIAKAAAERAKPTETKPDAAAPDKDKDKDKDANPPAPKPDEPKDGSK